MIKNIKRQLTLFLNKEKATNIEKIRSKYNPEQKKLIDCHVTLCREDEIQDLDQILNNLRNLKHKPISINFGHVERFENGLGVFIPATFDNNDFQNLRIHLLKSVVTNPRKSLPHIILMHPRN